MMKAASGVLRQGKETKGIQERRNKIVFICKHYDILSRKPGRSYQEDSSHFSKLAGHTSYTKINQASL